jgi:murein DD-endopeptidase MepM/ murein hydrolase activator NlpD
MLKISLVLLGACSALTGQRVTESALSLSAREDRCVIGKSTATVETTDRQVFFRFLMTGASGLTGLTVEWLAPGAQVIEFLNYDTLPSAATMCFLTQLPIAGFEQAGKPGSWSVRVVARGKVIHEKAFTMRGDPNANGVVVRAVTRTERSAEATDISLTGVGLSSESVVHLATYTEVNSWQFLASMRPMAVEGGRVTVQYAGRLAPGEYWIVVKNLDGAQSAPARLLVASDRGYLLPIAQNEQWIVTQGPYGGTSHWGRSLHAWDLAPVSLRSGGCITAMRGGAVHAFDRGEVQNSRGRSFGNLITIEHDDGEYSHYAHLRTGTFVVKTGQRVVAGQALAIVGNSGHTLGATGIHLHAHVTKGFAAANQSIPFEFANAPEARRGKLVVNQTPLTGSCGVAYDGPVEVSRRGAIGSVTGAKKAEPPGPKWSASVGLSEWWSQTIQVPKGTKVLDVLVAWARKESQKVDVYLTSPSGYQYGGPFQNPERLRVEQPETGPWRISVQGVKGTGEPIDFEVRGQFGR